ncbi:MAG: hypothetical protein J3Q66DRAFT_185789 [Benniella sp.]|nr:MAG: hypothetical protein J3Q66DRAFT_185789 [Benniella sp.]
MEIHMDASKPDNNSVRRSQASSTRDHEGEGGRTLPRPQTGHRGSSGVKGTMRTGSYATTLYCGTMSDQPIFRRETTAGHLVLKHGQEPIGTRARRSRRRESAIRNELETTKRLVIDDGSDGSQHDRDQRETEGVLQRPLIRRTHCWTCGFVLCHRRNLH